MAAGQQKKRLVSSSLHEHYRGKKKKRLDTSDHVVNLRSQIHLEWDANKKKAVAKREQIGITWKGMAPFVDSVPQCRSGIADVICVPREIYSLNNLMEVLSYEVWATYFSESERELLTQFLPSGTGEQAIQSLLSGENFHFINPFIIWSSSLCSGTLHPDDVLQLEQQIKSIKKEYYSELNKYHTNMLEGLKKLKDQWSRCNDPEKLWRQDLIKPKERSLPISSKIGKEVPPKVFICNGDIAKYMSYIKVSKKQHDAIKNLKCSGDGVLSKSLSHVLGDINDFDVHPYEALEREEQLRLHKHWLQVVTKDLPVAFGARKEIKLQREQLRKYLEQELSEKRTMIVDKTKTDHTEISPQDKIEGRESEHSHRMERIPSLNRHPENEYQDTPILGDISPVIPQFNVNANSDFSLLKPEPIEESDDASLFSLYTSQRINDHLTSLSSYPHHAHMNHLKRANGSLSDTVQFPLQFQHGNARENYPNQELDFLERARNNYWSGVEASTSNSDGSLFSVLSGYRNMQPQALNNATNPDYLQFRSSNSHEAAVVSTWMDYQLQQNSNMQDSIGKPFLGSWNR